MGCWGGVRAKPDKGATCISKFANMLILNRKAATKNLFSNMQVLLEEVAFAGKGIRNKLYMLADPRLPAR